MTARAVFSEDNLAAFNKRGVCCQVGVASRRGLQFMRTGALQEEERHIRSLCLGRVPVARVLSSDSNLYRSCLFSANKWIEMQKPFFAEQTNVQIDAV